MANVIIFGGELNWWWRERHREKEALVTSGPEEPRPALQEVTRVREP
jgi:hypothetical protein